MSHIINSSLAEFRQTATIEREGKQTRLLEDLDSLSLLNEADRYSFIQSFMETDEISLSPKHLSSEASVQEWHMRDFSPDNERADKETAAVVYEAGTSLFLDLKQCSVVEADTTNYDPYLRATISECSVLIARDETRIWAAHLGMSEKSQVTAALSGLQASGFAVSDIIVIASVGQSQKDANKRGYSPRFDSVDDYVAIGVDPNKIIPFEFAPKVDEKGVIAWPIRDLLIGKDGVCISTYDTIRHAATGRDKKVLDSVTESFIPA
jgi:hypothetical protein